LQLPLQLHLHLHLQLQLRLPLPLQVPAVILNAVKDPEEAHRATTLRIFQPMLLLSEDSRSAIPNKTREGPAPKSKAGGSPKRLILLPLPWQLFLSCHFLPKIARQAQKSLNPLLSNNIRVAC
jgi:hypothetical protein